MTDLLRLTHLTALAPYARPRHSRTDIRRPLLGRALGLVAIAIFWVTLPIIKLALANLSPVFITTVRAVLAGLAAMAALVALKRSIPWPSPSSIILAALMLVFELSGLMAVAMQTVPAAHGGVILEALPLATAGFAALLAGERPSASF